MIPFQNDAVAAVFAAYPPGVREKLLTLRALIFKTAAKTPGVGPLQETLKWGEPAYLTPQTKSGSTVRIAWKRSRPKQYGMYFICTTNLVDSFRTAFPNAFTYDGNRAILFEENDSVPSDSLALCVAAALPYKLKPSSGPTTWEDCCSNAPCGP